jgi:hypothetical protein
MRSVTKWLQSVIEPGLLLAGLPALFVLLPLLQPGLPGTADTPIHLYRTLELARSWEPGVVYPRWAPDLAYGYGYPLWNFVPPLPYAISLVFYSAGLSLEASLKLLIVVAALAYALGAYVLVRRSLGAGAGLLAAALYTLAPFALREVLLYGGNYPQYLAIGLYPWVLWALGRLYSGRAGLPDVALAALLYGAVILSHLFHALLITPVALGYAGLLWLGDRRAARRPGAALLALGLGLLATAFFWLPALIERPFTRSVEDVFVDVSPYYLRFIDWTELLAWPRPLDARAANPWVPFSLGPAALLLAALGLLALLRPWRLIPAPGRPSRPSAAPAWESPADAGRPLSPRLQGLFFLALLGGSLFMMLPASAWVWANAPLLALAEFPWRWLGLANLSLAFLGGAAAGWARGAGQRPSAVAGAVLVLLASAVYLYPFRPFVRYGETAADMASYELASQAIGTTTLGEYLPRWVASAPHSSPLAEASARGLPVEKLDRAALPEGSAAHLAAHSGVSQVYRFESAQPFTARFRTFYFPGWTARLDGQPADIRIEPGSGLISVPVPAGSHQLRLSFEDTPLRAASNAATGLTLVALLAAGLWRLARRSLAGAAGHGPPQARAPAFGWPWRPALAAGGLLACLLLAKETVVDPHTGWFRRASPPGRATVAEHPLQVDLGGQFRLLGYDVGRDRVAQGGTLRVVLYWQAQRPAAANYRSFVHLDSPVDQRTWAGSDNFHPGDATAQIELPTATWDTQHYVRDEHVLRVPAGTPPAEFSLRAGMYDPDTGRRLALAGGSPDTVRLQDIAVTPGRGLRVKDVPHRVDYRLGERIQLLGYDWDRAATTLTLYWQAGAAGQGEAGYAVFVHLLDEQGERVWGADGPPLGGLYPMPDWRPGEVVVDPRFLALDELPAGTYTLAVGLYDSATLARLPVTGEAGSPAGDRISLFRLDWP